MTFRKKSIFVVLVILVFGMLWWITYGASFNANNPKIVETRSNFVTWLRERNLYNYLYWTINPVFVGQESDDAQKYRYTVMGRYDGFNAREGILYIRNHWGARWGFRVDKNPDDIGVLLEILKYDINVGKMRTARYQIDDFSNEDLPESMLKKGDWVSLNWLDSRKVKEINTAKETVIADVLHENLSIVYRVGEL